LVEANAVRHCGLSVGVSISCAFEPQNQAGPPTGDSPDHGPCCSVYARPKPLKTGISVKIWVNLTGKQFRDVKSRDSFLFNSPSTFQANICTVGPPAVECEYDHVVIIDSAKHLMIAAQLW
jgi:hypothetical protein